MQSIKIGEPDFKQLRTFESNCASNDSKLMYMSLMIIRHLSSEDSAGKLAYTIDLANLDSWVRQ